MGLTDKQQAVLVAISFILLAIQGFLVQQTFLAGNLLQLLTLAISIGLLAIKELAGSAPSGPGGLLTNQQQALLLTIAGVLLAVGMTLSAETSNPLYLFILGLIGAAVMGLKEWLGNAPIT